MPGCYCHSNDCRMVLLAAGEAVSDETLKLWAGFVTMIVDAYFNKRMAW